MSDKIKDLFFGHLHRFLSFRKVREKGLENYQSVSSELSELSEEQLNQLAAYDWGRELYSFDLAEVSFQATSEQEVDDFIRDLNKIMIPSFKSHYGDGKSGTFRNYFVRNRSLFEEPIYNFFSEKIYSNGTELILYNFVGDWVSRTEYQIILRGKLYGLESHFWGLAKILVTIILLLGTFIFLLPILILLYLHHDSRDQITARQGNTFDPKTKIDKPFINRDLSEMNAIFRQACEASAATREAHASNIPQVGHIKAAGSSEGT